MGRFFAAAAAFLIFLLAIAPPVPASELTRAVVEDDTASFNRLLSSDAGEDLLDEPDGQGFLPLHLAVIHGQRDMVRPLLDAGAELDGHDAHDRTALMIAAAVNDSTLTDWLLNRGAELDAADDAGLTALHHAAARDAVAALKALLRWEPAVDATDRRQRTPLHVAVAAGQRNAARVLLEAGAGPNLRDGGGLAPLHLAAVNGDIPMIDLLHEQFADLQLPAGDRGPAAALRGAHALHAAVWAGRDEAAEHLIEIGAVSRLPNADGDTPLMLAIRLNDHALVHKLLGAGASLEAPDGLSTTPMALAMERQDGALIERLVDYGARINAPLPSGKTPLLQAVERGRFALADLLIRRFADPDDGGENQPPPLSVAVSAGDQALARRLLEAGANPDLATEVSGGLLGLGKSRQRTPLQQAVAAGDLSMTRLLIEHAADVTAEPTEGQPSLLKLAIDAEAPLVLRLLVAEGARPHPAHPLDDLQAAVEQGYPYLRELVAASTLTMQEVDGDENGPLHRAVGHSDDPRVVRALIEAGAAADAVNAEGRTSLHEAARRGHGQQVRALLSAGADPDRKDADGRSALDLARGEAEAALLLTGLRAE